MTHTNLDNLLDTRDTRHGDMETDMLPDIRVTRHADVEPTIIPDHASARVHQLRNEVLWTPEDGVTQGMLSTMLTCPAMGYWRYWRGLEPTVGIPESIRFGKAVHDECYRVHKGHRLTLEKCITDYGKELGTLVYHAVKRYTETMWEPEISRKWTILEELLEYPYKGWKLRGKIDGFLRPRTLLEIKTTTRPGVYTDAYAYSPQSIVYAYLLKHHFSIQEPILLYLVVIRRCTLRKRNSESWEQYSERVRRWYVDHPESVMVYMKTIEDSSLDSLLDLLESHMKLWERDIVVRNTASCYSSSGGLCPYGNVCLYGNTIPYLTRKVVYPELDRVSTNITFEAEEEI